MNDINSSSRNQFKFSMLFNVTLGFKWYPCCAECFPELFWTKWNDTHGKLLQNGWKQNYYYHCFLQGFWYFAWSRSREIPVNPPNPVKFTKTRKIPQNSVEILSNTCLYNIFQTYFSYRGYLLAVNLQIHLGTSSPKRANNVPKLPGVLYVAKNWALATMLKTLPFVHFWSVLLLKEQMMTSLRKTLKMLAWSAQNRSISSEICPENNHKIGRFLPIAFWWSLPQKLLRNSREIGRFFREFVPKNPAKFDFFFHDLSEALLLW